MAEIQDVEAEPILLLGIGYVLLPVDLIKDRIPDLTLAENYKRHFNIVPNAEDVPTYKHNIVGKMWIRIY